MPHKRNVSRISKAKHDSLPWAAGLIEPAIVDFGPVSSQEARRSICLFQAFGCLRFGGQPSKVVFIVSAYLDRAKSQLPSQGELSRAMSACSVVRSLGEVTTKLKNPRSAIHVQIRGGSQTSVASSSDRMPLESAAGGI